MEMSVILFCLIYCIYSHHLVFVFAIPSLIISSPGTGFRGQVEEETSDPCYSSQVARLSETEIADAGRFVFKNVLSL